MEKDSKFGQFEAAFESGQQGQVSSYETWLESHGFSPNRVSRQMITEHIRDHPEKTVNYDEQLQQVGEFAGHFAARGGTIHLPVTGVSGIGKTQFRHMIEDALSRIDTDFESHSYECSALGEEVNINESDSSVETHTEFRLHKLAEDVEGSENAVFVFDNCGNDKRVCSSMTRLESVVENAFFVTFWTPESWGYSRDKVEQEIDTAKQIKLSGLDRTEGGNLVSTIVEFIGGDADPSVDAVDSAFNHTEGVPGLLTRVLLKSLKQAFLNEQKPWTVDSVNQAADQMGIINAVERIGSLSQAKLQLIRHMLTNRHPDGIRPKQLVELLDKDKSTISYHLNDLSSSGIVSSVTEGRSARYSVSKFIKPIIQMRLEKEVEING